MSTQSNYLFQARLSEIHMVSAAEELTIIRNVKSILQRYYRRSKLSLPQPISPQRNLSNNELLVERGRNYAERQRTERNQEA